MRVAVLLGSTCVALLVACIALWLRSERPALADYARQGLADPELRNEVIAHLVASSPGIYDAHPDPDVGRVHQPNVLGKNGVPVTNSSGMREKEYALPKPTGTFRVILLGDSFVFGRGVRAADRMGARLEELLRERSSWPGEIECLHVGVSSWNARAECEFLRRNLDSYDPDLVIQLLVHNDLDDTSGVRGFGEMASFSSQVRDRADSLLGHRTRADGEMNLFLSGADWESRQRYARLEHDLGQLKGSLAARAVPYLVALHWWEAKPLAAPTLEAALDEDQILYLPDELGEPEYWVAPRDSHWSPAGHRAFGELLYNVLATRNLAPSLELAPWEERAELHRDWIEAGRLEARMAPEAFLLPGDRTRSVLNYPSDGSDNWQQVHGGIDHDGNLSPYASLLLRSAPGRLSLQGRSPSSTLDGSQLRVFAEGVLLGELELSYGRLVSGAWELPEELASRPFVNVRLESEDWVHAGEDRRRCRSFVLERIGFFQP